MTKEKPLPKKFPRSTTDFKVIALEGKYTDLNSNDVTGLRESEEKLKHQQESAQKKKNILLKQVQQPSVAQLRSTMVEPVVNLFFFLKMKGLMAWDYSKEMATSENFF
ncbi:unnamed protein product [Nyctereutes procyonoides]|uniref:Pre-mRNA-splicing regulator WTAP n=1 Tax=Nyctereutes procyonoides TaxID=34880 RepID=A0A811Z7P6_NYCPR|nr:unnamed protein product [Nyctereutes procyonoides]